MLSQVIRSGQVTNRKKKLCNLATTTMLVNIMKLSEYA